MTGGKVSEEIDGLVPYSLQPKHGEQGLLSKDGNYILDLAVKAWHLFLY